MTSDDTKKDVTLDDLALMVGQGFNGVHDEIKGVNQRLDKIESRIGGLEGRMDKLENSMEGLRSSVNNYLQLSDKRYLELKAREGVIVNWIKQIGDKTGVKINLEDLEKVV